MDIAFLSYLNIIINPIDSQCNLNCKYCYARENTNNFAQTPLVFNECLILNWFAILISELNNITSLRTITFTWHGGEPLLLPIIFYSKILQLQKKLLKKDIIFYNVIQTNGILLTVKKAKLFHKLGFSIGISFDGSEFEHNVDRFSSRKMFNRVRDNILNLSKNDIPFSIFTVIHERNINSEKKLLAYLERISPKNGVSFLPRFNDKTFLDPDSYANFLIRLFNIWWPNRKPYIAIFENFIKGLQGEFPRFCFLTNRCNSFISIDSKGQVYNACQIRDDMKIGDINTSPLENILYKHLKKMNNIYKSIKNKSLKEYLGNGSQYKMFSGQGCIKRLNKLEDCYIKAFAKVITHIEKSLVI